MKNFQPAIKWSGSKRSQCQEIVNHFPKEIDTYYEPFLGGASVLRALIESDINVNKYICTDINNDLINLWIAIQQNPKEVCEHYSDLWYQMNDNNNSIDNKIKFFNEVRSRYNAYHNPLDFMFIMRTTTNGMPRYNNNGEFNNSFHITRNGIIPSKLSNIIFEWNKLINSKNIEFMCCSYKNIKPKENDFVYLDPPYANTKGMYFGGFDKETFFKWLSEINCKWALSYDGVSGEVDCTYEVPKHLYSKHIYLKNGNSSFKRVVGKSNDSIVFESLYLN